MKYKKADKVLPDKLLREIQKYVSGELIYIPSPVGMRKGWGENSGSRLNLQSRNIDIKTKFNDGATIDQLTTVFSLSYDSIKKIVYSK